MARVETIVVGGGIAAASPFNLNGFAYVANTDPASVASSTLLAQVLLPTPAITIGTDPNAAATETFRITGGFITQGVGTDSTVIGRGASAGHTDAICIGRAATSGQNTQVVIGTAAVGGAGGANNVAIGNAAGASAGTATGVGIKGTFAGQNAVVINGTQTGAGSSSVVIGSSSTSGSGVVAIGAVTNAAANVTAIGGVTISSSAATGTVAIAAGAGISVGAFNNCIFLGSGTAWASQVCSIGTNFSSNPINTLAIGHGSNTQANPTDITIRPTHASGSNNAAGDFFILGGLSTGNATPGTVQIRTGTVGGSGTTLQTASTRLTVTGTGVEIASDTDLIVNKDRGFRLVNQTSAAGAAAGTLGNAPTAGDPAFWIPIQLGGVNYAIPVWAG